MISGTLDARVSPDAATRLMLLKVASYNIHRCVGRDGRCSAQRIVEVLREIQASVIGLQEVDSSVGDAAHLDQLAYLAGATGLRGIPGPTLLRSDGHYGNALLTRHPVLAVKRVDLSVAGREPRGALEVDLDVGATVMRVIVVHLGLGASERRRQARRLLSRLAVGEDSRPTLVMGDVNEWRPWAHTLRGLHLHLGRPPAVPTFPSGFPVLALDRIWFSPSAGISRVMAHRTPLSRQASDHLPITARLNVAAPAPSVSGP